MVEAVRFSMTASGCTSQNMAILSFISLEMVFSVRQTRMSGWMPMARSSLTLCCVGFVLSSPAAEMYGSSVTWM